MENIALGDCVLWSHRDVPQLREKICHDILCAALQTYFQIISIEDEDG